MADMSDVTKALAGAVMRFPGCRIANCDCNSKNGKWASGCLCLCHFLWMDDTYGKDEWNYADFERQIGLGDKGTIPHHALKGRKALRARKP